MKKINELGFLWGFNIIAITYFNISSPLGYLLLGIINVIILITLERGDKNVTNTEL